MTWQKFQSEVAFIWADETGQNHDLSHAENVKTILRNYAWELGKMEMTGASKQEQIAFAWKKFKEDFPLQIEKN